METKEFILGMQEYYGQEYRHGIQLNTIASWLDGHGPRYLECIFEATIKGFSGQYKVLPDIAVFESLKKQAWEIFDTKKEPILQIEEEGLQDYTKEIAELAEKLAKGKKWKHKEKKIGRKA